MTILRGTSAPLISNFGPLRLVSSQVGGFAENICTVDFELRAVAVTFLPGRRLCRESGPRWRLQGKRLARIGPPKASPTGPRSFALQESPRLPNGELSVVLGTSPLSSSPRLSWRATTNMSKAAKRRAERGPRDFTPIVKSPPILACDDEQGRIDGNDQPFMLDDILHPSRVHKCIHDFCTFMVNSIESTSCAVCDVLHREIDINLIAATDLRHADLLKASDKMLGCAGVRDRFFGYPGGDDSKCLDGLVLERLGFEADPPHRLRVCAECFRDLSRNRMPEAALANGLWLGEFPEHLRSASFVELIAASPVRVSGIVLALDELKVGNIAGSAKSLMRSTFTFYMQDAYGVQLKLPACDADIAGSITIVLVGANATPAQLRRLLGARRSMIEDLNTFLLDKDNALVGEHTLARQAQQSPENLATFSVNGDVPKAILDSIVAVQDKTGSYANARSTHAHENREPEVPANTDRAGGILRDDTLPTAPMVVEINAVMDTGEDRAVAESSKPARLRGLGSSMCSGDPSLAQQAAAEAAAAVRAGRPSPLGTDKAMVLTHSGKLVSDFSEPGLFIAAFYDLFPHGVGGPLDKRRRSLTFKRWARILLKRRDPRFRKHRTFLFCVCALIFRREAIENARFKLRGNISTRIASLLAKVTPADLSQAAAEMEGSFDFSSLNEGIRSLIRMMESVSSGASWTIHNKRCTRMIAISYMIQMGQPLIWLTISPADHNSPIVMKLAGVDIDVTSKLKSDFPDYTEKLRLVASDPVASAQFYHNTIQGVLTCLLRFGASDGDGGVLGRVKGYVGMTEEQKRLMLHAHLLVWIYGYNDFVSFRALMDKTPRRYTELARYLDNIVFNQIATLADINRVMRGVDPAHLPPEVGNHDSAQPALDPLLRDAKECMPVPPARSTFPPQGEPPDEDLRDAYARLMYLDLACVTPGANLHKCQATCHKYNHKDSTRATCHKYNHKDSCRFGFGDDGRPLAQETVVQRGRCVFDTSGNMTIDGVVYSHSSADDAAAAAANAAFQEAFDNAVADVRQELARSDPVSGRFSVEHKRLHTHINSFNPVIAFAVRSNMDIKVLLKGSDAKGLLYYILNYATKTEQTLDVLLPLLIPVVERIRADSGDAPEKEMAVRLVRSCLCKQLSSLPIGGPAAASKVLGLSDEKLSHSPVPCPMTPLLTWASKRDKPADADNSPGDDSDSNSGSDSDADDSGVIITPFQGKLTVAQRTHLLYRSRCRPDDTEHPLHQKSYFAWCREVRIEKCPTLHGRPRGKQPSARGNDDDDVDDVDDGHPGDECLDDDPVSPSGRTASTRAPRRGRPRATRYELVGEYQNKWEQGALHPYVRTRLYPLCTCLTFARTHIVREKPAISNIIKDVPTSDTQPVAHGFSSFPLFPCLSSARRLTIQIVRDKPAIANIMKDVPRSDTQPVAHARLLICMFVPFFTLDDLKRADETWPDALRRADDDNRWDPGTYPFRLNIEGMLAQKLAAAEETAKRRAERQLLSEKPDTLGDNVAGDVLLDSYGGEDEPGESVIPATVRRMLTDLFVDDAFRTFVAAGFNGDGSSPDGSSPLLSGRSMEDACRDISFVCGGTDLEAATAFISRQENELENISPLLSGRSMEDACRDISFVCGGTDLEAATAFISRQENELENKSSSSASALAGSDSHTTTAGSSNSIGVPKEDPIEPYIIELRKASQDGLSPEACRARDERRDRTNAEVADTDIGAVAALQHVAAFSIAQEFGLNRKQRQAFYIFANGLLAQCRPDPPPALRLYIGGGAGTGKTHVLRAIRAFVDSPPVKRLLPRARLLCVAFQGKQAAAVGGTTVHSVCPNTDDSDGCLSGAHEGQSTLPASKAAHWKGDVVLAIEEISMISCNLLVRLHNTACSMFPLHKGQPFGNRVVVMLGDFNQLRPIKARSLAHGTALQERRLGMTVTERYGSDLFRMANACVMLHESNRFSPSYAPVMERCLYSKCTEDDVKLLNTCVMGASTTRNATSAFDAIIVTFRNKVSTILTAPMMRALCQARGTPLFVARAHDVYVKHQRPGYAEEKPATNAPWPTGLREEINSLDDAKTKDLPTLAFLAVGAPVVVHKKPQFVLLGVCNNSDGIIRGIELDPREDFLLDPTPGYSVVNLRYAPLRVFVYIKTADDAGLHLEGLDRGVVAIAPVEKEFTIEGIGKRKFIFKRRQLPDILGIINYLHRLGKETLKLFPQDASTFTPASASLDAATDEGPTSSRRQRRRTTGRHGPGAARRVAHLIANSNNNCFFNSALALGLAAWDGQQLPPSSAGTPAAGSFFSALQLLRDCMFNGSTLPDHIVESSFNCFRAREVTPDQSARLRGATVITIPNGVSATFQDNVFNFFRTSAPTDLAIPGQSLYPCCADSVHENRPHGVAQE
ncbi:unnamed protein product [Ectocarpus sp. CCAP 1310/34]|nr:unnamed protein product [Ectocarpus sp. CCAP 1310/34]